MSRYSFLIVIFWPKYFYNSFNIVIPPLVLLGTFIITFVVTFVLLIFNVTYGTVAYQYNVIGIPKVINIFTMFSPLMEQSIFRKMSFSAAKRSLDEMVSPWRTPFVIAIVKAILRMCMNHWRRVNVSD